jgi:hypothetical protein
MGLKTWLIGCCKCGRLMLKNGKPGPRFIFDSVFKWNFDFANYDLASFDTKAEADAAAAKAGWQVLDEDGPNHRCPECPPARRDEWRGAYIPSRLLEEIK